ncbi:Type 1 glutamine amidotransferase-like domain-containing protein [Zobellia nedashkovskayae]|uniref:Type 1 glutamine amidotransferase-like domain-containing protein n=1 Tax=Zobellia nedashkovskayae TaxID=2779510 RepID=UPI00188AD317|nr:peptidase E [Zobellia nedashkovskayae]
MRKALVIITLFFFYNLSSQEDKTLFVYGGQITKEFVKYTAELTKKENPKICFLPTGTADSAYYINYWYELCSDLNIEPKVLEVWINSSTQDKSFEEILLSMDAVIVGGGNTLNMLAIWKAQEIDKALKKAYDQGIVLAGGSAGSLCWFNAGTTDSRPKELTIVQGLGFLKYSHCPHYHSEESRKPLYHKNILKKKLTAGYACDDKSGLVFLNGELSKSVSIDTDSFSYFVYDKDGKIVENKIETEIIK